MVNLDFVLRPGASREEIEAGIADIMQGQNLAKLAISIAIDRIMQDGLWARDTIVAEDGTVKAVQSKYHSPAEYWTDFAARFGLQPIEVSQYRIAGENYRKYRGFLEAAGFREKGNFTKLQQLDKVMDRVDEGAVELSEVKAVIVSGTIKDFTDLQFRTKRVSAPEPKPPVLQRISTPTIVTVERDSLSVDSSPVLSFSSTVDPDIRAEVTRDVKEIVRRRDAGLVSVGVEVTREEEALFTRILSYVREVVDAGDYPGIIRAYDATEASLAVAYAESFLKKRRANDNKTPNHIRKEKA
jgi:hypothetical protein